MTNFASGVFLSSNSAKSDNISFSLKVNMNKERKTTNNYKLESSGRFSHKDSIPFYRKRCWKTNIIKKYMKKIKEKQIICQTVSNSCLFTFFAWSGVRSPITDSAISCIRAILIQLKQNKYKTNNPLKI